MTGDTGREGRRPPHAPDEPAPVSRAEFEELRYRIMVLESTLRAHGIAPPAVGTAPARTAPNPLAPPVRPRIAPRPEAPAPPAPEPSARPAPTVAAAAPAAAAADEVLEFTIAEPRAPLTKGLGAPAPPGAAPPVRAPPSRASSAGSNLEAMLGQRWAPRVGALLIFLAGIFFLGLAIQRGWIGPLSQLGIAIVASATLLGAGGWLTHKKGYGAFPQILEATGACLLYLTAFMSYALPYYRDATGLTEVGGGLIMALVALGTVALALWRDSRVIVSLGYTLSFTTAGLGAGILPSLTIGYVALLGTSLAWVVARKRWIPEAAAGTVITGIFFARFTIQAANVGDPTPWLVPVLALPPLVAFVWLTLQRAPEGDGTPEGVPLMPFVAAATLAWGVFASLTPFLQGNKVGAGLTLLAWSLAAAGLAVAARRLLAPARVALAYACASLVLYLLWPPAAWEGNPEAAFANTASYAAGALALLATQAAVPAARHNAGLFVGAAILTSAASLRALVVDHAGAIGGARLDGGVGPWTAWTTLLLLGACFAGLLASPAAARTGTRSALLVGSAAVLGVFAFAVVDTPLYLTLYWVALAAALMAIPLLVARRAEPQEDTSRLEATALTASLALLVFAGMRAFATDGYLVLGADSVAPFEGPVGPWQAWVTLLVLGAAFATLTAAAQKAAWPLLQQAAFLTGAGFLALFAFAVVNTPLLLTTYWCGLAGALLALPLALRSRTEDGTAPLERAALMASVLVLLLAAARAVAVDRYLVFNPAADAPLAGPWEAWVTLALLAGLFTAYVAAPATRRHPGLQNVAFMAGIAFVGLWGFALFFTALLTTLYLVAAGGLLLLVPLLAPRRDDGAEGTRSELDTIALIAAILLFAAASVKGATYDAHFADPRIPVALAALEALLVAGGLLGLYHLALARRLPLTLTPDQFGAPLVGGSAIVLASFIFAYGSGAWTSILLGALGVAYLTAGFLREKRAVYRYTGFAILGVVLVRVFSVDLGQTDLAIRAIVFAVLGAILLGIGYVYARANRNEILHEPPSPPPGAP